MCHVEYIVRPCRKTHSHAQIRTLGSDPWATAKSCFETVDACTARQLCVPSAYTHTHATIASIAYRERAALNSSCVDRLTNANPLCLPSACMPSRHSPHLYTLPGALCFMCTVSSENVSSFWKVYTCKRANHVYALI
jgi:hypothetical protein